jgi:hypothetical protein
MSNYTEPDCEKQVDLVDAQRGPLTAAEGTAPAPAGGAPYRRRAARIVLAELLLKLKYGDEESETRRIRTLIVANCTGELRDVNAELLDLSAQLDAIEAEEKAEGHKPFDLSTSTDLCQKQLAIKRAYNKALYRKWTIGVLTPWEAIQFNSEFPIAALYRPPRRTLPPSTPKPIIAKGLLKIAKQVAAGKLDRERARQIVLAASTEIVGKAELSEMFNWALRVARGEGARP